MITHHRPRERAPFLADRPLRSLGPPDLLVPCLRQGLYRLFRDGPRRRALLPDYGPEGIHHPLKLAGLEIAFYPVGEDLLPGPDLERIAAGFRPDLAVYIHHFGLYLPGGLRRLRACLPAGALLLEDGAHTLPRAGLEPEGDLVLDAFPKLLGVAEGARIRFRGPHPRPDLAPGPPDAASRALSRRLRRARALGAFLARPGLPRRLAGALERWAAPRLDYYPFLMAHYAEAGATLSERSRGLLERLDWGRAGDRRIALAGIYARALDPRLLFPVPAAAHTAQALLGFPVRVDDQARFHAHLWRRGVQGFRLTDRWWFAPGPPGALFRGHYLLPLNHHHREADILRAAEAANAYLGNA